MLLNDVFPSRFVKAADLHGREVTVIIGSAEVEKIGDDRKLVLYFQGKDKGLVTNKTNADRIAMLYGPDTDGWIGKEIVLYKDFVAFQGKNVEAIRIKPPTKRPPPSQTVTAQPPPPRPAPAQSQHVVTDKGGYSLSEMKGRPSFPELPEGQLPEGGDDIPF